MKLYCPLPATVALTMDITPGAIPTMALLCRKERRLKPLLPDRLPAVWLTVEVPDGEVEDMKMEALDLPEGDWYRVKSGAGTLTGEQVELKWED